MVTFWKIISGILTKINWDFIIKVLVGLGGLLSLRKIFKTKFEKEALEDDVKELKKDNKVLSGGPADMDELRRRVQQK